MECAVKSNVHSTLQVYNPIMMGVATLCIVIALAQTINSHNFHHAQNVMSKSNIDTPNGYAIVFQFIT